MDGAGSYLYQETTPKMQWKLTTEHKMLLDYDCTAATCSYRGRNYKVWFTTKIPLSMVLGSYRTAWLGMEAETEEGDYHWTVTGIEKPKTVTPIYFLDRNYVKTSRENTRKQERLLLKDPAGYLESYGYNFTTTNFNGQVVKLTLFTFDNPLERE